MGVNDDPDADSANEEIGSVYYDSDKLGSYYNDTDEETQMK